MLMRTVVGLAIVLAAVSGSLAAQGSHANNPVTAHSPTGAYTGTETGQRSLSESESTVWGWRYAPEQKPTRGR